MIVVHMAALETCHRGCRYYQAFLFFPLQDCFLSNQQVREKKRKRGEREREKWAVVQRHLFFGMVHRLHRLWQPVHFMCSSILIDHSFNNLSRWTDFSSPSPVPLEHSHILNSLSSNIKRMRNSAENVDCAFPFGRQHSNRPGALFIPKI